MSDCLFCNFATGKIKKDFVLETKEVMVFPDIKPLSPVHLLIVPKRHIREFSQLAELDKLDKFAWDQMMAVVLKLIKQHGLEKKGYRIVINGGGAQAINHLHVHLIGGINKETKL